MIKWRVAFQKTDVGIGSTVFQCNYWVVKLLNCQRRQPSETWCHISAADCGNPPSKTDATFPNLTSTLYGTSFNYTCKPNYHFPTINSDTWLEFTCSATGVWVSVLNVNVSGCIGKKTFVRIESFSHNSYHHRFVEKDQLNLARAIPVEPRATSTMTSDSSTTAIDEAATSDAPDSTTVQADGGVTLSPDSTASDIEITPSISTVTWDLASSSTTEMSAVLSSSDIPVVTDSSGTTAVFSFDQVASDQTSTSYVASSLTEVGMLSSTASTITSSTSTLVAESCHPGSGLCSWFLKKTVGWL